MAKKMSHRHMEEYEHMSPAQMKRHMAEEKELVKAKKKKKKK